MLIEELHVPRPLMLETMNPYELSPGPPFVVFSGFCESHMHVIDNRTRRKRNWDHTNLE